MPASIVAQGTGLDSQSTATLLEIISKLRQELLLSQAETQKVNDNLNCLISLVKRAWTGEKTATLHLANIVGAQAHDMGEGGRFGNLGAGNTKTRAVSNWERLSMKLLDREYENIQREIQHRQLAYMENRHKYMQEILESHHHDMAGYAGLRAKPHSVGAAHGTAEDVDKKFLKTFSRTNLSSKRPPSGSRIGRSKSAGYQRSQSMAKDIVERAEVTLRELVIEPNNHTRAVTANTNTSNAMSALYEHDPDRQHMDDQYLCSYDDPSRYTQSNLFDLNTVFGQDSGLRKARPLSAAFLKERDTLRSRPRSAGTVKSDAFITQKCERPLKYETTRPVPPRTGSSKLRQRRNSASRAEDTKSREGNKHPDVSTRRVSFSDSDNVNSGAKEEEKGSSEDTQNGAREITLKKPTAEQLAAKARAADLQLRIDRATKRPECVDRFETELQEMGDMERQFRQTTLQLQKKLGIDEKGFLYL